jgi:hypothetical protein
LLNPEGQPLVRSVELDELTLGSLGVRVTDEGGHVVDRQLAVKDPVTWAKELSEIVDSPCHMLELALEVTPLPGQLAVLPRPRQPGEPTKGPHLLAHFDKAWKVSSTAVRRRRRCFRHRATLDAGTRGAVAGI